MGKIENFRPQGLQVTHLAKKISHLRERSLLDPLMSQNEKFFSQRVHRPHTYSPRWYHPLKGHHRIQKKNRNSLGILRQLEKKFMLSRVPWKKGHIPNQIKDQLVKHELGIFFHIFVLLFEFHAANLPTSLISIAQLGWDTRKNLTKSFGGHSLLLFWLNIFLIHG